MAKKGMVARDVKRAKLAKKQAAKRAELKAQMRANAQGENLSIKEQLELANKLASLPRNGSATRMRNRCQLTGPPVVTTANSASAGSCCVSLAPKA